jgi:Flp pilus assembly protein TadG
MARPASLLAPRRRFLSDEGGATAVEFVLILTPLILLTLGAINLSLMIYTVTTLHYATEDAARCATVRPTVCADTTTLQTYAQANYGGMTAAPTFTLVKEAPTATTCPNGNFVTGTADYHFETGITSTIVPLSASACYPAA